MKKTYISPSMKAHKIKPSQIICGSGDSTTTISSGSGTPPSSNNGSISGESKDYFFFED